MGAPLPPLAPVCLESLLDSRRLWRGQSAQAAPSAQPTGHAALDAALPSGGWPEAALTELLLPMPGVGELALLWPALARLSQAGPAGGAIVLVDPPLLPYAPAWRDAGVALARLQVVRAQGRDALWAAEQCLRSGACAAVLCWPQRADDRALRRLQVAAESGQCLGFALRGMQAALNPSPAALRIAVDAQPRQLRVLKCRGGNAPARPIPFDAAPSAPIRLRAPLAPPAAALAVRGDDALAVARIASGPAAEDTGPLPRTPPVPASTRPSGTAAVVRLRPRPVSAAAPALVAAAPASIAAAPASPDGASAAAPTPTAPR